ncbi:MAG: ABC transporter permease [Bacteroidales bacterium]
MKNNTLVILQREYLNKVKKKSFLVMTILAPLLFAGLIFAPALLMNIGEKTESFAVVDETGIYTHAFDNAKDKYVFFKDTVEANDSLRTKRYEAVLWILSSGLDSNRQTVNLYYDQSEPSMSTTERIEDMLKEGLQSKLMHETGGINAEIFELINNANINLISQDINTGLQSYNQIKTVLGYIFGFLIYGFIFLFGAQIMSGVIEEKSNRIIEVMISSVKPFQLLMGKIIGLALVGITQLLIWVIFTAILLFAGSFLFSNGMDAKQVMEAQQMMASSSSGGMLGGAMNGVMSELMNMIASINLKMLLIFFLCYFLGGYLLYAALFAAVGAAVDNQEDTNQFMWPITIPLLLGIIVSMNILQDPNGSIAFWFSMIPFTSPITMMIRLPFGVPSWQIALSLGLLVLGFIFTTYIAARIYRVGILMYGKKITYKELWKWLRYKA